VNGTPKETLKGRVAGAVAVNETFWEKALVKSAQYVDRLVKAVNALGDEIRSTLTDIIVNRIIDIVLRLLPDTKFTPRTRGERASETLIVLGLGAGQTEFGEDPFNNLYSTLFSEYRHVKHFASAPDCEGLECLELHEVLQRPQRRQEVINEVAAYIDSENIKTIVLAGFSYGGGLMYELGTWLADSRPGVRIIGVAYVDAIDYLPGIGVFSPQDSLPVWTLSALNIFQRRFDITEPVNGNYMRDRGGLRPRSNLSDVALGNIVQIDADHYTNFKKHSDMDDDYFLQVRVYINRIIDDWYPV
jgi:hypothetical protein